MPGARSRPAQLHRALPADAEPINNKMTTTFTALQPGDTVGILGGGQLGRMLALAAAELGLNAHIYAPEADSCAFAVAREKTCAASEDETALARFASNFVRTAPSR